MGKSMVDGRWSVVVYHNTSANYQLSTTNYQLKWYIVLFIKRWWTVVLC